MPRDLDYVDPAEIFHKRMEADDERWNDRLLRDKRKGGARRGAGRKALPLSERKVAICVSLHPTILTFLQDLGSGSPSLGVDIAARTLIAQKEASLAAIKQAAEARDQSTVKDSSAFD